MSSVERKARELLADQYENAGMYETSDGLRSGLEPDVHGNLALRAIDAALREQPEARGVVDDAMVERAMNADAEEYGASIPASRVRRLLTAAQQPVQEGGGEVEYADVDAAIANIEATPKGQQRMADARQWARGVLHDTAPPSAPVGDFEDWLDRDWPLWRNNPDNPIIARLRRAWDAALTQQPAQAAPGWKLVPVKATEAMQEAFNDWRQTEGNKYAGAQSVSAQDRWEFRQRYAAMLAAAPPGDDAAGDGA